MKSTELIYETISLLKCLYIRKGYKLEIIAI